MKSIIKNIGLLLMIMFTLSVHAQTSKADKNAAKAADLKRLIDSKKYLFIANQAFPMGGSMINLTGVNFDLKLANDTLTAFLPYYGVAFSGPINPNDGGIKLTTTRFNYKVVHKKNGNYQIEIRPINPEVRGSGDVNWMILNVSRGGYATLQVFSFNRQPISFTGWLQDVNPKKAS
jgi:hypothetical protein